MSCIIRTNPSRGFGCGEESKLKHSKAQSGYERLRLRLSKIVGTKNIKELKDY